MGEGRARTRNVYSLHRENLRRTKVEGEFWSEWKKRERERTMREYKGEREGCHKP